MNDELSLKRRIYRKICYLFTEQLPDPLYIKMMYQVRMNKKCNLRHPVTYNEKLNWMKLHDRNPLYSRMADKYLARDIVADKIGEQYLVPLLGVWEKYDDIDFDSLPDEFVLKCTHDSGSVTICRNKSEFDVEANRSKFNELLKKNFYWQSREWVYRDIKPRIICEEYIEDLADKELRDYKFFCFDGQVKALFVAIDRGKEGEEVKFDFFDENYARFPMKQGHPNAGTPPQKPSEFEEMKRLASILSEGIPHVRIDFYQVNGHIYFSEFTFFHHSGFVNFDPEEWDKTFGDWIHLPI